MKFEIKHRFSGEAVFVAEINCGEDDAYNLKMGLAVKAALASKANLSKADLSEANLRYIKHDIWGIRLHALPEVPALRQALIDGEINGSQYAGECACLCGTIANVRGCDFRNPHRMKGIKPDSTSMAERFFMGIMPGNTPDNNGAAKMVLEWIDEFQALVGQKKPKKVRA